MANRRMFSKNITNKSKFLRMAHEAQALYFHLGMNADDDGFVEWYTILQMTSHKEQSLKILQVNGFVQIFDDDVLVILNWTENNQIRKDRYQASIYLEKYGDLIGLPSGNQVVTNGKPRLGEVRLGEVRLGEREPRTLVQPHTENPYDGKSHCGETSHIIKNINNKELGTPKNENVSFFEQGDIYETFVDEIKENVNITQQQREDIMQELEAFTSYWTEMNGAGTKQRWQMEKTFEFKRRFRNWLSRSKTYKQNKNYRERSVAIIG